LNCQIDLLVFIRKQLKFSLKYFQIWIFQVELEPQSMFLLSINNFSNHFRIDYFEIEDLINCFDKFWFELRNYSFII